MINIFDPRERENKTNMIDLLSEHKEAMLLWMVLGAQRYIILKESKIDLSSVTPNVMKEMLNDKICLMNKEDIPSDNSENNIQNFFKNFLINATHDDTIPTTELKEFYDLDNSINGEKISSKNFVNLMGILSYKSVDVTRNRKTLKRFRNLKYKVEEFIRDHLIVKKDNIIESFQLFEKYKNVYNLENIQKRSFEFLISKYISRTGDGNYTGYDFLNN